MVQPLNDLPQPTANGHPVQTNTQPARTGNFWSTLSNLIDEECTFYRVHLVAFTLIPLIASAIFYASNGQFHVRYLDSLFLCYSAMTVTGLTTVNLSMLTVWQQVLVYLLMTMGDITTISWIVVLVRKRFLRKHCEYIVARHFRTQRHRPLYRSRSALIKSIAAPVYLAYKPNQKDGVSPPVLPTIIEDVTGDPGDTAPADRSASPPLITTTAPTRNATLVNGLTLDIAGLADHREMEGGRDILSSLGGAGTQWTSSPVENVSPKAEPITEKANRVDFALSSGVASRAEGDPIGQGTTLNQRSRCSLSISDSPFPSISGPGPTTTTNTYTHPTPPNASSKYHGHGGFPSPFQLAHRFVKRAAPTTYRKLQRKMTIPAMQTLEEKDTAYLNFDLNTGRNSYFHTESLSDEQVEMLGGTEYRALRWLSYVVPLYFICTQLLAFMIFAPWLSTTKQYDGVFEAQPRLVNKTWFSLFQSMGAYTGGGLSLVDLGMVPFQQAYLMIFPLIFVILAGNHALPVLLRLVIWICSKVVSSESDSYAALSFLLDHPRRCFFYLFPSHQTWFLVIVLILFSTIEWVSFVVLNNGLSVYELLPVGVKVVAGLFQGIAARASGFSMLPLASFAPALLFLYVVMMYIAVYPVALSIHSTNVYEERSLGVYEVPPQIQEPQGLEKIRDRRERIGKYLYWHLRRQMSIDIWWLVWAVFFIAIVERNSLMDQDKKWFDLFRVLFEVVSAFGGIGLSLGLPSDNYSFAGAMRPLSKLIIIAVMVRGRHRGLPVAVDRAIILPTEMITHAQGQNDHKVTEPTEPQPLYSDFGA